MQAQLWRSSLATKIFTVQRKLVGNLRFPLTQISNSKVKTMQTCNIDRLIFVLILLASPLGCSAQVAEGLAEAVENQQASELPLVYSTDFEESIEDWELVDDGWTHKTDESGNKFLSLHKKKSNYKPEFRSPFHQAILQEVQVTDFQFDCRVLSTHKDYPHRDAVLFFGYQSPSEFYYVHLGKATDKHCNQIFIVNNAARTLITAETTEGTPWDDQWHNVRVTRNVEAGEIKIYFDDMETPVMTAVDKTFAFGRIGLGSFDDTADFDDVQLHGEEKVGERQGDEEIPEENQGR